jgi:hypothetical protein
MSFPFCVIISAIVLAFYMLNNTVSQEMSYTLHL